jgi:hypothetical protein
MKGTGDCGVCALACEWPTQLRVVLPVCFRIYDTTAGASYCAIWSQENCQNSLDDELKLSALREYTSPRLLGIHTS